ncbi:hypothetical protein FOA43_003559 [Brettanomyces nanus]|uniref:F-box domain-containing protein n=1 Tax=Eeniella nana TaxID=13502 RepID=A0A875S5G9_EENNA|nr:uncharacterized protein FOA43_003559 [Brettanomyces nanus]QPG76173.1 hypothetical protein FOA43_003559 [Brettanomyces nanus]
MSFDNFQSLPKELQLEVLEQCDPLILLQLQRVSRELESLSIYSIRAKLLKLLYEGDFYISIFSPQHEEMHAELYDAKCVVKEKAKISPTSKSAYLFETSSRNTSHYVSFFEIGDLNGSRDPLRSEVFDKYEGDDGHTHKIHLLVGEDSKYIQLHFGMYLKMERDEIPLRIFCMDTRLKATGSQGEGVLDFCNGMFRIKYKLIKGEELPPRGPYDYEVVFNYFIEFSSFEVNNLYLLNMYKDSH